MSIFTRDKDRIDVLDKFPAVFFFTSQTRIVLKIMVDGTVPSYIYTADQGTFPTASTWSQTG